ncbi:glycosyltransferase family 2 protein [Pseudomonas sp. EA_35y_Pfl2_R111]|uniref:glycosyltransferase family 2 protein n=1 Tax=Pseudomonas sp. EA_35y_Pfl2_R111 TaxID=3088689 RepID=UPI0030DAA134
MTSSQLSGFAVTVVIPTADRGVLLRRSLDCVLAQTVSASEIILVDNGREDAHTEGLAERVRVIRTAPRIGPGRARNVGTQAAACELVAFLDDDDLWLPDYLERVIERFQETGADAVLGQLMRQPVGQEAQPYKVLPDGAEEQRRVFYSNPGFGGQNLTIRREVFLAFGGFDEAMPASEDRDLAARMLLAGKRLASQPRAIAILCDHAGGRARHSLAVGNWVFFKKHWRNMRAAELYRALKVLVKRRLLVLLGR